MGESIAFTITEINERNIGNVPYEYMRNIKKFSDRKPPVTLFQCFILSHLLPLDCKEKNEKC